LPDARQKLIRILQSAYSGELAAGFAYRGHWKSLKASPERERIKEIEAEEWHHRDRVGRWLEVLGARPRKIREAVFWTIGRTLGLTCHLSGRFMPMYFAGRLESGNVVEYEVAAKWARELQMDECVEDLLDMGRVELEHEIFFRQMVTEHRLLPVMKKVFKWG
jgi:demethoxyubiquinone hydroxylase (CLK1/Coq7/Cat5 family)